MIRRLVTSSPRLRRRAGNAGIALMAWCGRNPPPRWRGRTRPPRWLFRPWALVFDLGRALLGLATADMRPPV